MPKTKLSKWLENNELFEEEVLEKLTKHKLTVDVILEGKKKDISDLCKQLDFSNDIKQKLLAAQKRSKSKNTSKQTSITSSKIRSDLKPNKSKSISGATQTKLQQSKTTLKNNKNDIFNDNNNNNNNNKNDNDNKNDNNKSSSSTISLPLPSNPLTIMNEVENEDDASLQLALDLQSKEMNEYKQNQSGNKLPQMGHNNQFIGELYDNGGIHFDSIMGHNSVQHNHQREMNDSQPMYNHFNHFNHDINNNNNNDNSNTAFGDGSTSCNICLEVLERDSMIKSLSRCSCKFHADCLDKWGEIKQRNDFQSVISCPLHCTY